jgi:hypothetical protein
MSANNKANEKKKGSGGRGRGRGNQKQAIPSEKSTKSLNNSDPRNQKKQIPLTDQNRDSIPPQMAQEHKTASSNGFSKIVNSVQTMEQPTSSRTNYSSFTNYPQNNYMYSYASYYDPVTLSSSPNSMLSSFSGSQMGNKGIPMAQSHNHPLETVSYPLVSKPTQPYYNQSFPQTAYYSGLQTYHQPMESAVINPYSAALKNQLSRRLRIIDPQTNTEVIVPPKETIKSPKSHYTKLG